MRRFLCLDQSLLSTGFALWDEGDALPKSGTWQLCEGIKYRALAFVGLHREIGAIHRERPITGLGYEQPIKTPSDKVEKLIGLYGMAAHAESICHVKGIPFFIIGARSWRSTFIGKEAHGVGSDRVKRMAVERCRHFGMNPLTHDEAEAVGILDHYLHTLKIVPPWREANPFLPPCG